MSVTASSHPLLLDPDYPSLKQHLIDSTGLAYYQDKDEDLAARIAGRLSELALKGCGVYLDLLTDRATGQSERQFIISQLTIGETYFFRHAEQFDGLRDVVLPDLIERNQTRRTLRIWSAGCATGAEPYSIAILLKQYAMHRIAGWDIQILGTDINQRFLATAALGVFDERALRATSDDVRGCWFSTAGRSSTIAAAAKEWVRFQYHNLVEDPYPSIEHGIAAFDLILCRNVMIYFDWALAERIISRFHASLVDGGWLAVGHAESNTDVFRAYRTVNVPGATLYQKAGESGTATATVPFCASMSALPSGGADARVLPETWSPPALPIVPNSSPDRAEQQPATRALTRLELVRQLGDEGRWTDAAQTCEQLLESERLNPVVHFYQALILQHMDRHDQAEQAFRRALYLDRTFVLAHYHLALLLGRSGRLESAVQSLRNMQRLLPTLQPDLPVAHGDGVTPDDLGRLAGMHLVLWRR